MTGPNFGTEVLVLLTAITLLLGIIAVVAIRINHHLKAQTPEGQLAAFRAMLKQVGQATAAYAHDTAALQMARQFRDQPELLARAPLQIREIIVGELMAEAKNLSRRLEIIRGGLRELQRKQAGSAGSMFGPEDSTAIRQLEDDRNRLRAELEEIQAAIDAAPLPADSTPH